MESSVAWQCHLALPTQAKNLSRPSLGYFGERFVARYLQILGWQVVRQNYRLRRGEIDIIALDQETLVFVEVKTRRSTATGTPHEQVAPGKVNTMRRVAGQYLMQESTPHRDVRLDVVGVYIHPDAPLTYDIDSLLTDDIAADCIRVNHLRGVF